MEPKGSLPHLHVRATCLSLTIPFFILGISQLGHKTRPGHCNMQHWRINSDWSCMCVFIEVFLSALYFRVTCCPTFRACTPFLQVPYVPECPAEGLENIRHLREWGTSCWGGGQQFALWGVLLQVSWLFSRLGRTLSESWMALQWGGRVPGVRT